MVYRPGMHTERSLILEDDKMSSGNCRFTVEESHNYVILTTRKTGRDAEQK